MDNNPQWKNTNNAMKRLQQYIPKGNTYPLSRMPMLDYWNAIEPSVYLTLFEWLAPLKESRDILRNFADKADPAYAQPTYLAYVVLTPVQKISGHLLDICAMEGIVEERTIPTTKHKLRHQVTAYVAKQYLAALVEDSGKSKDSKEDKELSGEKIGKLKGITKILLNLPRQFQHWNKCYTIEEDEPPKKSKNRTDTTQKPPDAKKTGPFDITERIHPSFHKCVLDESETGYKPLTLNASWDIQTVSKGLLKGKYDIKFKDFNHDPIETFKMGKSVIAKPRGDTAKITTKRKSDTSDAKLQKSYLEDPDNAEESINSIICENLKTINAPKLKGNDELLRIANAISLDIIQYITQKRPRDGTIKKTNYINVRNGKKPKN
jgi:hypothetical protein